MAGVNKTNYIKIIEALHEDIDTLIKEYDKLNTLSYKQFAEVWRKLDFSLIYCGYNNADQAKRYTESGFKYIQKKFLTGLNYRKLVAYLYIMYGLYYKQPIIKLVKFRFTKDDLTFYNNFKKTLRENELWDALYIATKLEMDQAFYFVALNKMYGMNYSEDYMAEDPNEEMLMSLNKFMTVEDGLPGFEKINKQYLKAQKAYKAQNSNSSVIFLESSDLVEELKRSFQNS